MSSESLHAPRNRLSAATLNQHHAITSLREELDAVDWYRQRADDCEDVSLRDILLHNMREEIEHACMVLEWLRRSDPDWAAQLDVYLYSQRPITEVEEEVEGADNGEAVAYPGAPGREAEPAGTSPHRLTVGSLRSQGAS